MNIWWVRHGPTHQKTMVGWSDVPADLSDHAAIARLDAFLPAAPVMTSDLARTIQTADALGNRPRLGRRAGLREMHFGAWELRGFAEVEAETPDLIRTFWETPGDVAPPNGESWNDFARRINGVVDDLLAQPFDDLIIVAHFGVIVAQIARALDITPYQAFGHRIANLSVTKITYPTPLKPDFINHLA